MKTAVQPTISGSIIGLFAFCYALILTTNLSAQTADNYIQEGKAKKNNGVYTEAIKDFSKALAINPQLEEAYYERGQAYFKIQQYSLSLTDYTQAIQIKPQIAENYYQRGVVNTKLNNTKEALSDFDQSIRLSPTCEYCYVARANLYRKLKLYKKAIADCNQALKLVHNYDHALSTRGLVYLDRREDNRAYEDLRSAVNRTPNESIFHNNLAEYYKIVTQSYQTAMEEYTTSIRLNPRNAEAYCQRAKLRLILGDDSEALRDAKHAIYIDRRYLDAIIIRSIAHYNLEQYDKYTYYLDEYVKQAKSPQDYYDLANNVFKFAKPNLLNNQQNILNEAEKWIIRAAEIEDTYDNNFLLAKIRYKLKKTAAAQVSARHAKTLASKERKDLSPVNGLLGQINRENKDYTPPSIRIISPVASTRGIIVVEAANKITVIGQVTDESGVSKVLINGNLARLKPDGSFDGETILTGAENLIIVEAFDNRGNQSQKSFNVNRQPALSANASRTNYNKRLTGKCRALLIATNYYDSWSDLVNPILDARAIKEDLETIYRFDVELLENPTKEEVMLKIKEYARKQYNSNDQLFIFFAGHGQFDEVFKEGYVVAKDSRFDDESKSSYISHSNLRTYINSIPCKHVFLVMDVCFGGTFDTVIARRGQDEESSYHNDREELINRKMKYTTRRYMTSGGKEYVPDGRPGHHSPFVRLFLEALRQEGGKDRILTLDEIKKYVSLAYPEPHSGEFGDNEPGSDFFFVSYIN